MNSDKIKVAIIGAGGWGYEHARVLKARKDVELCGIVGRTAEKTASRAAEFGTRGYTSIGQMLAKEKPDLVTTSLPNQQHFEVTRQLIAAGVPLFVEKPFVFDRKEADTLIAEAAAKKLFFGINFNHRYAKPVLLAHQAISQGRLGEMIFAHWRFGGEGGTDHPFNNLIETQCHGFDMLEHLCGPIESVCAQMCDKTAKGFYRTLALALQFHNGGVGTLLGSYDSSYAYPDTHLVEINGTQGRILIEDTVRRYTFNAKGSETAEVWQSGYFNDRDRGFYRTFDRHMDDVLTAFKNGAQPPIHARAGRRALMLALAAIESFQTGKRVTLSVDDYEPMNSPAIQAPPANP
jgi:myo-inositol 2-dehydrogenase / D-chiro-inositol 1-dehydrogenase